MGRQRPMRTVICDSSCLIDLRNGDLLTGSSLYPTVSLSCFSLFDDELLDISAREKDLLADN